MIKYDKIRIDISKIVHFGPRVYVLITEIIWLTFDVIERLCFSVCAINSLLFLNERLLSYFLTPVDHCLWIKTEFSSNMSKQKVTRIWTGLLPDSWHLFYSLFPFWDREELGLRELKFIVEWERRSFAAAVIQHFVVVGGAASLFNSESKKCGHHQCRTELE